MRCRWFVIAIIAAFLPALLSATTPAVAPQTFDRQRAVATIRALTIDIGPRAAATMNEGRAAAWLAERMREDGLSDVYMQPFAFKPGSLAQQHFPVFNQGDASTNVVGTIPGTDPRFGTIYLGAHYDSVPTAPGANDNASGVAVLLDVARQIQTTPISATVQVIAFGSEEYGLLGSIAFASRLSSFERLTALAMISVDCAGVGTHQVIAATRSQRSMELRDQLITATTREGHQAMPIVGARSDHVPFSDRGIAAVHIATVDDENGCGPAYHSAADTIDTIAPALLEATGSLTLAALRSISATATPRNPQQVSLPLIAR